MKKIQLNKIKLGLSLLSIIGATAIVAPILVSCGNSDNNSSGDNGGIKPPAPLPSPDVNEAIFGKEEPTVSRLKEFFTKPAELIKADKDISDLVNSATNIQVDRESLKNEYFDSELLNNQHAFFETRLCLNFFNNEILKNHKNYEMTNEGYIINKEHNYILNCSINFQVDQLTIEDQEFIKLKTNWKDQPKDMTDREYQFEGYLKGMERRRLGFANITAYTDWTLSQMGKLKIIPTGAQGYFFRLKNNNERGNSIYINDKGELGIFTMNFHFFNKFNMKIIDFYENVLGVKDFDKDLSEWTLEQIKEYAIIQNEIDKGIKSGEDSNFFKSKPLNITKTEETQLITKITIIKPETIIEDIKNKTIEEKLKLFNIEYQDNLDKYYSIFGQAIKDINVSKIGDNFQIEIEFIDFITDQREDPFITLPDGLKLYSCLMSPWYTPKTIY